MMWNASGGTFDEYWKACEFANELARKHDIDINDVKFVFNDEGDVAGIHIFINVNGFIFLNFTMSNDFFSNDLHCSRSSLKPRNIPSSSQWNG